MPPSRLQTSCIPLQGWQGRLAVDASDHVGCAGRYEDELARKRAEAEHEKQRVRQIELVRLQEDSSAKQEARKVEIQAQIEAERRATEKYRVRAPGQGFLVPV